MNTIRERDEMKFPPRAIESTLTLERKDWEKNAPAQAIMRIMILLREFSPLTDLLLIIFASYLTARLRNGNEGIVQAVIF